jgi:addiction module HigA family antidote
MGLKDRTRIERLVRETQSVTAGTALRLAKVFGTSANRWMNLQSVLDLSEAAIEQREALSAIAPLPVPTLG